MFFIVVRLNTEKKYGMLRIKTICQALYYPDIFMILDENITYRRENKIIISLVFLDKY